MLLKRIGSQWAAVGAAVLASACCTVPLLAVFLGVTLLPASALGFLVSWRPVFLGVALIALATSYYFTFVHQKTCCDVSDRPRQRIWFGLLVVIVVLAATSTYWIAWIPF